MNDHPTRAAPESLNPRLSFYVHLGVYVAVNALLIAINLSASPDALWFQWPLLGWGIGLGTHAVVWRLGEKQSA